MQAITRNVTTFTITTEDILSLLGMPPNLNNAKVEYLTNHSIEVTYCTPADDQLKIGLVRLNNLGDSKTQTIKVVREYTSVGLEEAKDLVESYPCTIGAFPLDIAERLEKQLLDLGNKVEIKVFVNR